MAEDLIGYLLLEVLCKAQASDHFFLIYILDLKPICKINILCKYADDFCSSALNTLPLIV